MSRYIRVVVRGLAAVLLEFPAQTASIRTNEYGHLHYLIGAIFINIPSNTSAE